MIKEINAVQKFHEAFGLTVNKTPTIPDLEISQLRAKLHNEEIAELEEELLYGEVDNIENVAKELADTLYVLFGTVVAYGLQDKIASVFAEIHRANMSKLDENGKALINGENGVLDESRALGKVLKSSLYKPANVKHLFE